MLCVLPLYLKTSLLKLMEKVQFLKKSIHAEYIILYNMICCSHANVILICSNFNIK